MEVHPLLELSAEGLSAEFGNRDLAGLQNGGLRAPENENARASTSPLRHIEGMLVELPIRQVPSGNTG